MSHKTISLTEFILEEERRYPKAHGDFTHLLTQIEYAGKIIASHIKKAGLVDILGKTGEINSSSEEVIELDRFSNALLIDTLSASGQVFAVGSEELSDFHKVTGHPGNYIVFIDPLDGSSNTEIDVTVGTIFSIYKKSDNLLQPGKKQIAAGYILYGTSVMFVYSTGRGVNGFTLDPSIGSFLLSHPDITIPESGNIYSINEAHERFWDERLKTFITTLKATRSNDDEYKARYIGSMVADIHRTLLKGGIFIYPGDSENPEGKLRLNIEVNPMSFLIEQAGGKAISGTSSPLDIQPTNLHQRVPVAMGSPKEMELFKKLAV